MTVRSLASSSKGNAYLVEHDGQALLVDCGLNYKELTRRLGKVDSEFVGVVITHSHTDHIQGLKTFLKHYSVPVYANSMTAETVTSLLSMDDSAFVCFENGQPFEVGTFVVSAFSIPHDTSDPVGYTIRAGGETYFHGTDIGTPLDSIGVKLAEADIATLESNHDPVLLRQSQRPPNIIQRIAGPRGHLSNDQSADLVRRFASTKLKQLMLAHLSGECNTPHLAELTMRETLKSMGRGDVVLTILNP